jgi:hypothetical protein
MGMNATDLLTRADELLADAPDNVALCAPCEFVGEFEAIRGGGRALVTRGVCGGLNVDPAFAHFVHDAADVMRAMRDELRRLAGEQ